MSSFTCLLIGNQPLTIECGKRLIEAGHVIKAVATSRLAVANWAESEGLTVLQGTAALTESDEKVDWLFSVANLEMISGAVLARATEGAINFHDGPLPRYAGLNAPVWAILAGEETHGITWHLMEESADTGDILVSQTVHISAEETAFTLNAKCFAAGVESFDRVLEEIANGLPERKTQDISGRSYFGLKSKPDGVGWINPASPAAETMRMIRALDHAAYDNPVAAPWVSTANGAILVGEAERSEGSGAPGEVLSVDDTSLTIVVSDGALRFLRLRDTLGNDLDPRGKVSGGDILTAPRIAKQTITASALVESFWRKRLADYRPTNWAARGDESGVQHFELSTTADTADLIAAFGATVAALSGGGPVDLAYELNALPGQSPWCPIRFDTGVEWASAQARVEAELEIAATKTPFALDLLARMADVPRQLPMAGVSATGARQGKALTLVLGDTPSLAADTSQIPRAEADLIAARISSLLGAAIGGETLFGDLPLLPEAERQMLIEDFNDTWVDYPYDLTTHAAFEAQARKTPDETALIYETRALTYYELNAKANRLAHVLRDMGVGPGQPVGLHMARSENMVIAALAIMKAGGAYVPLDPKYPPDRIAFYAKDSQAKVIVSEEGLPGDLVPEGATRILADKDPRIAIAPATNPESGATASDLAYLIYTSGSTGTPKGVMIEHRNVQNFFTGMDDRIDHEPGGIWLSVTSLSFDISVLELCWTLARGFKVVLLGDEKFVAGGTNTGPVSGGMDFSLFYWGNDDGVGRDKYGLLLEGAKFADDNGFQAIWTPERHFHAFGGLYPNPSVTGAAAAAITKNIAIRAGSCVAPLHHPARIAEEWAVIDNLTDGKTGLAIASGWQPDDFVLRPENTPPNNKAAMMQAIKDVRKLWRGEEVMMEKADGTQVARLTQPRPVSKELNVWITTAGNPDTWRQAGEVGAHVLTHLLGQSVEDVGEKIKIYHAALREAGHNPDDFTVTLMLHTFLAGDRDTARNIAREPMKDYLRSAAGLIKQYAWAFPAFKRPEGTESPHQIDLGSLDEEELEAILDFAFERYFEHSGLFGTVDDAMSRVAEVKAIGVTEVACLIDYGIDRATILEGLKLVAQVRTAANTVAADNDFSIAAQISRYDVTHMQCTPYMARMLVENDEANAALKQLKHLMIGGEAMPAALVADLRSATNASVENMYGPTETTIWSTTGPGSEDEAIVSVGKPIANTGLYVLNDAMQPVGVGQVGKLWIGGAGVARGYWERAELTDEKFVPNPFHEGRMFGTGDLARWWPDGTLDFLGRADNQIKIRGYRIELGEIEAAMEGVAGVTQAVAVVRHDASGVGQIYGYFTGSTTETDVRGALTGRLPIFMVPTRITQMDVFPLTPNLKIDRKALPEPVALAAKLVAEVPRTQVTETTSDAPPTALSEVGVDDIANIWKRVLNVPAVQPSDSFFDLGGHSLLAIEVHRTLKAELGLTGLSIADIFRAPTLSGLHAVIAKKAQDAPKRAPVAPTPGNSLETPKMVQEAQPEVPENSAIAKRRALRANRSL
ncbi:MAG: MupA/Atu3671 family FMN-dependent luciferase-like monooxygenase [Pseudomonadota bacterium]